MTEQSTNVNEEEYEKVDLDLPTEVILNLALEAHEKDITLNQHINNLFEDYIKKMEEENAKEVERKSPDTSG